MRLKSLDIQGFKSFADRTKLEFTDGITAVIGPNGSGKSNIADAVRWVLGEQSTRTLRGGKMEDVIFGGTQLRKPQGVASVTLCIDNSDRTLGEFETDEVSITRRLYRSGDSEYRVNGTQVRLKDINELFMDTGLGRDGYSIIGQGRVAEIVSARSRERREIFEEAAGISKFRYRKTEAERRLALAEENLVRLRDILLELSNRLAPLRAQSEKAQQFLELATEKKLLEISVWIHSLSQLRDRAAAVEDKLLLAQNDHRTAEKEVAECERLFAAEMDTARALMVQIEQTRREAEQASEQAAAGEARVAVLQNDIGHHERAIAEAQQVIARAGDSRQEVLARLTAQQSLLEQRRAALQSVEQQLLQKQEQLRALQAEQNDCAAGLEKLRSRRAGAFEAIENARLDEAAAGTLLGESTQRIAAITEAYTARIQAVEQAAGELRECEALLTELEDALTGLLNTEQGYALKQSSRAAKVAQFDAKLQQLERDINERRQRARLLADMDKNMEGFAQSIKYIMGQARGGALRGVLGPVSSLLTVQDAHTVAIETALGAAMQNIVVEDEATGKRAIGLLRDARAGRATFLPLSAVKGSRLDLRGIEDQPGFVGLGCDLARCDERFAGVLTFLLGRVVVAEDLDAAVAIAKRHGYRFRVVTLDGQVVNAGGSMTGGYTVKSAGILGRQGEIEKLTAQAAKLEEERLALQQQREAAARELAAVQAEIDGLAAQKKSCEEDKIRCLSEQNAAQQRLAQAERLVQDTERERRELTGRIEQMRQKSSDSKGLGQTLAAELDTLQRQIGEAGEHRDALAERHAGLLEEQNAQTTERMLAERDIHEAEQELARLETQLGDAAQHSGEQQQKIDALRAEIARAEAEIAQLTEQVTQNRAAAAQQQQTIAQTMAQREQCEQHCNRLRAEEREQSARRDNLYREVVRLTEQKNGLEGERDTLINRLYDEYEVTLSDAEQTAQPVADFAAANRRLSELRSKIKALGSVNVDAIEEYREVFARHGDMSRQLADVEGSKQELGRMIAELTEQMCEIFKDKFDAINRNFSQTFRELFEGGSASLLLTDPEDLLESGIEIKVQPPGKVIKNLASLSGGEQAFVAIAIFFSILKVNPSPFCLMDEIEAALDDVNVARFAAYLHTLTRKTQFIAITHRRGTMESADVLYGVTMQEEGVSKLLELQVSEIEKNLGAFDETPRP